MKLTLADIKKNYPHPVMFTCEAQDSKAFCYCVGGALALSWNAQIDENDFIKHPESELRFPTPELLGNIIRSIHPQLDPDVARDFVQIIIDYNDDEMFGLAWHAVDQVLNWTPGKNIE